VVFSVIDFHFIQSWLCFQTRSCNSRHSNHSGSPSLRRANHKPVISFSIGQSAPLILGTAAPCDQVARSPDAHPGTIKRKPKNGFLQSPSSSKLAPSTAVDIGRPISRNSVSNVFVRPSSTATNGMGNKRSITNQSDCDPPGRERRGYGRLREESGAPYARSTMRASEEQRSMMRRDGLTKPTSVSETRNKLWSSGSGDFRVDLSEINRGRTYSNDEILRSDYQPKLTSATQKRLPLVASDDFRFERPTMDRGKMQEMDDHLPFDYRVNESREKPEYRAPGTNKLGDAGNYRTWGYNKDEMPEDDQPRRPMMKFADDRSTKMLENNYNFYNSTNTNNNRVSSLNASAIPLNDRSTFESNSTPLTGASTKQPTISFEDLAAVQSTLRKTRRIIPIEIASETSDYSGSAEVTPPVAASEPDDTGRGNTIDRQQRTRVASDERTAPKYEQKIVLESNAREPHPLTLRGGRESSSRVGTPSRFLNRESSTPKKSSFDEGVDGCRTAADIPATSTPLRRSNPGIDRVRSVETDGKVDLLAVRNNLRPVADRKRSIDGGIEDDGSKLINEIVRQTFDEVDAGVESTRMMLSELDRARSMFAEQISAGNGGVGDTLDILLQLTTNSADRRDNTAVATPSTACRESTARKNTVGRPGASLTMTSTEDMTTKSRPPQNYSLMVTGGTSVPTSLNGDVTLLNDDNNNNINLDGLMSPAMSQMERIMMWQTKARWDDAVDDEPVREFDECLDQLCDSVSSVSRSSTDEVESRHSSNSGSGGGRVEDKRHNEDDEMQERPTKFEYFFGFDVGVKGK